MRVLRSRDCVATTARKILSRSPSKNARSASRSFFSAAHWRTVLVASSATTRTRAPVSSRPRIFCSPTPPAPTTKQLRPSSFTNMGKRLLTGGSRSVLGGKITRDCVDKLSREEAAQLSFAVTGEEAAQVLAFLTQRQVVAQQPLDGIGYFRGRAAVTNRPRNRLLRSEGASHAEVICIYEATVDLDLLALDPDVGDPMLTATVGAPGDMKLQVLIE